MSDAERARSFGAVAAEYDRVRPSPPAEAIAWLLPPGARTVLDLAAGTGLATRALIEAGARVIAVEPDDRMRELLLARSPQVRALAGVGEDIPLPDASVDAVVVSSAWHWMDPVRAVPEIARVLRDGGRFGAVWTGPDASVAWVRELRWGTDAGRGEGGRLEEESQGHRHRHQQVDLPAGSPFAAPATREVRAVVTMATEDVVALTATFSQAITAPDAEREAIIAHARGVTAAASGGAGQMEVPLSARCWRADRLAR